VRSLSCFPSSPPRTGYIYLQSVKTSAVTPDNRTALTYFSLVFGIVTLGELGPRRETASIAAVLALIFVSRLPVFPPDQL